MEGWKIGWGSPSFHPSDLPPFQCWRSGDGCALCKPRTRNPRIAKRLGSSKEKFVSHRRSVPHSALRGMSSRKTRTKGRPGSEGRSVRISDLLVRRRPRRGRTGGDSFEDGRDFCEQTQRFFKCSVSLQKNPGVARGRSGG